VGLIEVVLSSLPSAPGTGFGAATAAAGTVPAVGGGAPPMCDMGSPSPDFTPAPPPMTSASPPMSWDSVVGPPGEASVDQGSAPREPHQPGSERFFHPPSGTRDYVTIGALQRYGDWVKRGGPWTRAAKALTGLVVVPAGAILTCAENSIRSPLPG
jgi:hypothetical protein